jgi:rubredoxin
MVGREVGGSNLGERRKSVMNMWRCTICGYIYDPAEGDVDNGVPRGTPFEALPDSWECPRCAVGKELFVPVMQSND